MLSFLTRRALLRAAVISGLGTAGGALLTACGASSPTVTAVLSTAASVAPAAPTTSVAPVTATSSSSAASTVAVTSVLATTQASTASAAAKSAAVAPTASAHTVQWFSTGGLKDSEQQTWKGIFAAFEKQRPDIKVDFISPGGDENQKFVSEIAAGNYPDIHGNSPVTLPSWAYKQVEQDMTPYLRTAKFQPDAYSTPQLAEMVYKGKWYGLPSDDSPVVIFYNKALFRKAGVPEPPKSWGDPSWTWDSFLNAALKTTSGTGAGATFGWLQTVWYLYLMPWVWANDGAFANSDRSQITVTDSPFVDAFQWYADLRVVHRAVPDDAQAAAATWESGRIGMMSTGAYSSVGMDQTLKSTDWDVAPYPTGKSGAFTRSAGDSFSLVNHASNPQGGVDALLFVVGLTGQKMLAQAGYVPVLKAALSSPEFQQPGSHISRQVFADGLAHVRPTPVAIIEPDVHNDFGGWSTSAGKPIADLLAGRTTAKDMLQKLEPQFQDLLNKAPSEWRANDDSVGQL